MTLYFNSQKLWTPPTDQALSPVLATVLVPTNQTKIATWESYLELLSNRVEWMIQQEPDRKQACRMIHYYLAEGHMDHQIWNLPDPEDEPQDWAQAITIDNPELRVRMTIRCEWDFPLPTIKSPEALEIIQQTPLEVWLQSMTYQPTED